MRYFLGVLFFATSLFSAEVVNPSQEEVEYEKAVAQAKAEYDAKVNFAKKKLLVILEARLKEAMARGNLPQANYLNDRIKSLTNQTIKLTWYTGVVTLMPDGTIAVSSNIGTGGTWKMDDATGTYIAIFGAFQEKHLIKLDRKTMTFVSMKGNDRVTGPFVIE